MTSYTDLVIEHFRRPHNKGRHPNPNAAAEGANPLCGDRIRMECDVLGARVVSAMFSGDACAICVASASLLSDRVRGASVREIMALSDESVIEALQDAVPPARRRCAILPLETLRQALTPFVAVSIARPVVLAAGAGRRFGGDKMLATIDGQPMIRQVATAYTELCGQATIVISGDERLRAAIDGLPVDVVVNEQAAEGIASSIRLAVEHSRNHPALMIALGDEPRVDRGLVMRVMQLWHDTRAPIVAPRYNDGPGHPVLFDEATYDDLLALSADRGARGLIERYGTKVLSVEVGGPRPVDIDTTKDLEKL
jgi:CTP:molybdopterin cytidylyltransferase MocA/NifU-like protein involved in Fe-S cluster formation